MNKLFIRQAIIDNRVEIVWPANLLFICSLLEVRNKQNGVGERSQQPFNQKDCATTACLSVKMQAAAMR